MSDGSLVTALRQAYVGTSHRHKGREVPLNTPYGAKASLMIKSMKSWPELSTELLDQMRRPVNACVNQLIRRRFQSTDAELYGITT